ncbi:MAG: nickel pincer cofactor biosynthesis protein LarC [Nitrospirae bacterium]|nr:nickel pincer cofactor biosynthesis protein LarC [Nitrospirota bacterium]
MIAFLNCFSGISGDMLLGALVDAGVPLEDLKEGLAGLPVTGYELTVKKVKRAGIRATKVEVEIRGARGQGPGAKTQNIKHGTREAKKWKDIEKIIKASRLSSEIKRKGSAIFKRLFEAEARVHGEKMQDVHLHELGAVDCLVDIFGTLIGLDVLGIETVLSSSLNLGSGTIKTEHGDLPVPAPATVELLRGKPAYASDIRFELTTPTGAVLVSSLAKGFGPMPEMSIVKTAYGAGSMDFREQPNVLGMIIGKRSAFSVQRSAEEITVIETNIDDMNPQVYEYVMERLFRAGALDVFLTQVIMKKGRPGVRLSVLCGEDVREKLMDIIFTETTSIGVRFYRAERKTLDREIKPVKTKFGSVNVKLSRMKNKKQKSSVEYEDCKKIAERFNVPLLEVMKAIR